MANCRECHRKMGEVICALFQIPSIVVADTGCGVVFKISEVKFLIVGAAAGKILKGIPFIRDHGSLCGRLGVWWSSTEADC